VATFDQANGFLLHGSQAMSKRREYVAASDCSRSFVLATNSHPMAHRTKPRIAAVVSHETSRDGSK